MPLDPVLETVTVLTPQLIGEGRVGIEPGAPRGRPLVSVVYSAACSLLQIQPVI
jgi:hypothetical protein